MKSYQIEAPAESVLGGPVVLHVIGDGWRWLHGVAGRAVWPTRQAAEAFAARLPDCRDWRGASIGRPVVVETDYPGEMQAFCNADTRS